MASHHNGTLPAKQETERQSRAVSLEKVPFRYFFDNNDPPAKPGVFHMRV